MKITMLQLEAFHAVMTLGTATAAAGVMNSSQPSVTRSILQLEQAIGFTLFNRVKGRLVPTAEAAEFFATVEESFRGLGHIRHAADNIRRRRAGTLRIACLPALSQGFIARVVADFTALHPEVTVAISTLLSPAVVASVQGNVVDLGIAAYEAEASGVRGVRFTACDEVILLRRDHRLAARDHVAMADLADERIIRLPPSDPYWRRFENLAGQQGVTLRSSVEAQTSAGVCALVAEGMGIALVNPLTALDALSGRLVMRRFGHAMPFVTTLLQPENASRSPLMAAFVRALSQRRDRDLRRAEAACGET